MDETSYDHGTKAGNPGDVIKHAFLLDTIDRLIVDTRNNDFWYVDTHTARPYHRLPSSGQWSKGIGKLKNSVNALPSILAEYLAFSLYEDDLITKKKTAFAHLGTRLYLGSSALVYQRIRQKSPKCPLRMTLFDIDTDVGLALSSYFDQQQAQPVLVFLDKHQLNDQGMAALARFWDTLGQSRCLIVKGSSCVFLPGMFPQMNERHPDLVFVDPHKLGDQREDVENLLGHCDKTSTKFLCWTPLQAVTDKNHSPEEWSFTHNEDEMKFVETCQSRGYRLAWFAWDSVKGGKQKCYGCQMTFDSSYDVASLRKHCEVIEKACHDAGMKTKDGRFRVKYWPE